MSPALPRCWCCRISKLLAKLRHVTLLLRWAMRADAKKVAKDIPSYVESASEDLPHEAETMNRTPEQRAMFEENFRVGYAQVEEGEYEMALALWDWGFQPSEITQPVTLFYGDADDIISPDMPLHLCAELADCTSHRWEGAPHYGFVDRERWIEFVTAAKA